MALSRRSRQREAILKAVRGTTSHPTAIWIYEQVRKKIPNISVGTVYRNLNLLAHEGLILELDFVGTASRFDGDTEFHSHLLCKKCGCILDVSSDEVMKREIIDKIAQSMCFKVTNPTYAFVGLCGDCQSNIILGEPNKKEVEMAERKTSILVVDDEKMVCDLLYADLSSRGYLCTTALNGQEALANLAKQEFDVILLDIRLPGMSGIEVLREIWLNHINAATIMITAVNDVDTAVEAMKLGASDYIVKPFELDRVDASIRTALEAKQTAENPPAEMEAVARGVEAKLDPFTAYSKVIAQKTIEIARHLGINEEEIQRWAAAKLGKPLRVKGG